MTMTHKQGSNAEADAPLTFVIQTTTLQGMSMALRAYSTLLVGMETLVVQWLHRRREAVSDVQRMLERLPLCRNIGEVWHVQRVDAWGRPTSACGRVRHCWQRSYADDHQAASVHANRVR